MAKRKLDALLRNSRPTKQFRLDGSDTHFVKSQAELEKALKKAKKGDTIVYDEEGI